MTLACTAPRSGFVLWCQEKMIPELLNDASSSEDKNEGDDETSAETQGISTSTPKGRTAAKGALTATFHLTSQH